MKIRIGSIIKFYTVLLLSEKPKHGYNLMKELEEKLGRKISASQVYPFLNVLEKNKLVTVKVVKKRGKKVYKLTKNGKNFVNSFLQRFGDLFYIAMEPKLTTCVHCGCKVYSGGYKEKIRGHEFTFCCCHCANSFKRESVTN